MPFFDLLRDAWMGALLSLVPVLALADAKAVGEEDSPRGAYVASQCVQAAQCPLFDEVYANTPAFRHALALNLRHGDEAVPDWVKGLLPRRGSARGAERQPPPARQPSQAATTASAMLPLRIDGRSYLLGRMSDPQDPRHLLVALYDTQRGFATLHYVNKEGKAALLGDTEEVLRKALVDYLNPGSGFAASLARPDVALPVPVSSQ